MRRNENENQNRLSGAQLNEPGAGNSFFEDVLSVLRTAAAARSHAEFLAKHAHRRCSVFDCFTNLSVRHSITQANVHCVHP